MYKRKGCELWTIEETDFRYGVLSTKIEIGEVIKEENYFTINDLFFYKEVKLLDEIDIILEHGDKKYLGYLMVKEDKPIYQYQYDKGILVIPESLFIICQKDYLKDVEIIKEKEYII